MGSNEEWEWGMDLQVLPFERAENAFATSSPVVRWWKGCGMLISYEVPLKILEPVDFK